MSYLKRKVRKAKRIEHYYYYYYYYYYYHYYYRCLIMTLPSSPSYSIRCFEPQVNLMLSYYYHCSSSRVIFVKVRSECE